MAHFEPVTGKMRAQEFDQSRVLFNRKHSRATLQQETGQRAKARSDFNNVILSRGLDLIYDPTAEIAVVKEILSEAFHR